MSSLTRVEDSLAPLLSVYKSKILSELRTEGLSEIEEQPKGEVTLGVIYTPFQQISERGRTIFFGKTIILKRSWHNSEICRFSVSKYIQSSLVDTLRSLASEAEGHIHKAPLATIVVIISIGKHLFDGVTAQRKFIPVTLFAVNAYQNAFIGISPSSKPLENTKMLEASEEDSGEMNSF